VRNYELLQDLHCHSKTDRCNTRYSDDKSLIHETHYLSFKFVPNNPFIHLRKYFHQALPNL